MKRGGIALLVLVGVIGAVFLVVTLTDQDEGHIAQDEAEQAVRDFAVRGLVASEKPRPGGVKPGPARVTDVDCELEEGWWVCKYDSSAGSGVLDFKDPEDGHPEITAIR